MRSITDIKAKLDQRTDLLTTLAIEFSTDKKYYGQLIIDKNIPTFFTSNKGPNIKLQNTLAKPLLGI